MYRQPDKNLSRKRNDRSHSFKATVFKFCQWKQGENLIIFRSKMIYFYIHRTGEMLLLMQSILVSMKVSLHFYAKQILIVSFSTTARVTSAQFREAMALKSSFEGEIICHPVAGYVLGCINTELFKKCPNMTQSVECNALQQYSNNCHVNIKYAEMKDV